MRNLLFCFVFRCAVSGDRIDAHMKRRSSANDDRRLSVSIARLIVGSLALLSAASTCNAKAVERAASSSFASNASDSPTNVGGVAEASSTLSTPRSPSPSGTNSTLTTQTAATARSPRRPSSSSTSPRIYAHAVSNVASAASRRRSPIYAHITRKSYNNYVDYLGRCAKFSCLQYQDALSHILDQLCRNTQDEDIGDLAVDTLENGYFRYEELKFTQALVQRFARFPPPLCLTFPAACAQCILACFPSSKTAIIAALRAPRASFRVCAYAANPRANAESNRRAALPAVRLIFLPTYANNFFLCSFTFQMQTKKRGRAESQRKRNLRIQS